MRKLWRRFYFLLHRSRLEREIAAEIDEHRSTMPMDARRDFGNALALRERARDEWGFLWVDHLAQDLRYAWRVAWKNPAFSSLAILTASLGIGANTSIFSVLDAVLLRPLPYPHAEQLVSPINVGRSGLLALGVGDFQYAAWRNQASSFESIAAYVTRQFTLTGGGGAEELDAGVVTPGFLHVLGTTPFMGRDLATSDAAPHGGQVALLSYSLWSNRFASDPAILSRSIVLNGKPYLVAGILPRDFEFPENAGTDLLIAMPEPAASQPGGAIYYYSVIARLKPGVTAASAEADLRVINRRLRAAFPNQFRGPRADAVTQVTGLHDRLVGNVRPALAVLTGAVGLVLLIVCVNISNLLLSRALARQREIAVRIALGSGRGRIVRQLLTESMSLALAGGVAGLALAFAGAGILRAIGPKNAPHLADAHVGGAVLAFNLALAIVTGALFGLAPMREASTMNPEAALKQSGRTASGARGRRRLQTCLVISEMALALILLAGAGLLMRTFAALTSIDPGFQPMGVVTARLSLPYWKYRSEERRRELLDELLEQTRRGPGVNAAGFVACLPFEGFVMMGAVQTGAGSAAETLPGSNAAVNFASGDYFKAMGIPVLEGRAIDDRDRAQEPAAAVVNRTFVRQFLPGRDPLGTRIRIQGVTDWLEIAGVVGDLKQTGGLAGETRPEIFQPAAQSDSGSSAQTLVVRSTADSRVVESWLRGQIASMDRDLPPAKIETMTSRLAALAASQLFVLRLLGLFAGIAIVLAAIGVYSVLAYTVQQRRQEIGIRVALGAKRRQIVAMILAHGFRLALAGVIIGTAGGLALTRYLRSLLYGVTPHDPLTLSLGCGVVLAVALAASYLPARRAVEHDTAAVLRVD